MDSHQNLENVSTTVTNTECKKVYTDEERQELAEKLDQDLDDFISGLERKSYTEGWPEDRWQEEMEKHPFFTTKVPEAGEEMSPLMQGLQQLKYDPLENTPEELATTFKEEGNFNFKCKKYRAAIINYTEGIKVKCKDNEINATLYNNRSASNYFLKNYRSSLSDCKCALKLKDNNYSKAKLRAAQCLFNLNNFEECKKYCDELLLENPKDSIVIGLRTSCVNKQKEILRNERKLQNQIKKEDQQKEKVLQVIKERGIRLASSGKGFAAVEPNFPEITLKPVHLDVEGRLIWPVLFAYPEYRTTDFVQAFHEDVTFDDMFLEMFSETPNWDVGRKYIPGKLNLYIHIDEKPIKMNCKSTLGDILTKSKYVVQAGTPVFSILVQNSKAEDLFLKNLNII